MNCICIVQVSEPYQTLVSLRQSILCDYDNVTFLWGGGGVPDMPNRFGCEATDWLRCIWSSCKRFRTWSQCCHFGLTSVVQILIGVGVSTVQ